MTRNLIIAGAGILLLLITGWYSYNYGSPSTPVSSGNQQAITAFVTEFGTKLKDVPLLAPAAERKAAMETAYANYVAPELLAKWEPEGAEALGRYTSSPWPDRISVVEVRQNGSAYIVEGNVVEVANSPGGTTEPVAVYPVTLTVEMQGDVWLITAMTKGAYSELPHQQSIVGFWECLPHKNTSGPQTLECAFGIAVDQSDGHYAVDTSLMSRYPVDYPTGTKVRVTGVVTPANQLSSEQKYDIDGIIRSTTIEKL